MKGVKIGESIWNYFNEPLAPKVLKNHVSNSFKFSEFLYNGSKDPKDHLAQYNNHINILRASDGMKCRAFSTRPLIDSSTMVPVVTFRINTVS